MAKISKRQKLINEKVQPGKVYSIDDALKLIQDMPAPKFVQSVDVSVNLGVDPRKSEQAVRGATVLPNGTGRDVRVAVITSGANTDKAQAAGADPVGFEDLAETIKKGEINFDVLIATPDAMRVVGQLGQVLGPRGLMPNPKVGTVTADVTTAVKNAKAGQVRYRTDKNGIVHCTVGKINFTVEQLKQNIEALLLDLKKVKPSASKGIYMKKLTLSSTMGPGLIIDINTLNV